MKKTFTFIMLFQALAIVAKDEIEIDSDSNAGTVGLIVVSVFLVAGIVLLAWKRKGDN